MATREPSSEAEKGSLGTKTSATSIPEPERYSNSSSPEPEPNVEPMPEWTQAIQSWGYAWDVHLYGLGALFIIIAMSSMFSLVRLLANKRGSSSRRKVSVVLLGFLSLYGISRSVFLCVDAYHHKKVLPVAVLNIIWGIAQPCLITSYSLLFVVLRNAIRLKQRFQTWFTSRNIGLVTVPHFLFVFGTELIVSFSPRFKALTFICQLLYALFSFILALFYASVTVLIWKSVKRKNNANRSTRSDVRSEDRINRIICMCTVAAIGGVLIGATQLYAMAGPFGVFSSTAYASAWPWYWLTTIMRLLEGYMAIVLFSIAHHQSSKGSSIKVKVACGAARNIGWTTMGDKI